VAIGLRVRMRVQMRVQAGDGDDGPVPVFDPLDANGGAAR